MPKRSQGTFVVGILGGSVAWHTGIVGSPIIKEVLESDPLLEGKTVEVVLLAKSAYKQPQQLMAYNYVTVLGAEFDALVNIDGYNEVVLTVVDNFDRRTAIAYPSAWHVRAIQLADPSASADARRLVELRAHRQTMARRMHNPVLKWSQAANLVWHLRDRRARVQLQQFGLEALEKHDGNFIYHGPANSFTSGDELHRAVVDLWFRSSLQLHAGSVLSGTIYLHVLQPNQYHEGSKPMGPEEQKVAIRSTGISVEPMREIYPLLVKAGQDLTRRGVHFSDQTMLFADVEEPIYIDPCCHFNEKGNEMLAQQVAEELLKALRQQRAKRKD